ncbi:MAG: metal-dependent hydrolase, partial [Saprospiraceae bacterium]
LLDLDLLTLSAASEVYDKYAEGVKQEYAWVPEEMYSFGRKQVLSNFLEKENIYFTTKFILCFEVKARENLEREISNL